MSTSLYLLTADFREAAAKLSELDLPPEVVADTLESISGELEAKSMNVGYVIRNLEASADAIDAFTKAQAERSKALKKRAAQMRDYLASCMVAADIKRISGPGIELKFRASSAVVIDEEGLIPATYMTTPAPPPPAPSKTLIAAAIKAGAEVPGAHIEHRQNLQIS